MSDISFTPGNMPLTCVIKTNPGEHFSAITLISTMISLDAYELLTGSGRVSRMEGGKPYGARSGKEIDHGN